MAIQIFNDGSCIRIEKNGKVLLVSKEQVKTIDTVHDNIVRVDIGEGPLKNIFLNYQEVTQPVVASANQLRDEIKGLMISDNYNGGDATEATQLGMLSQLTNMAAVLELMHKKEEDLTNAEPTRIDESNPNTIYKGWHNDNGEPGVAEWAVQRIRRVDDIIISDWADGARVFRSKWDDREVLLYIPLQYGDNF